jgi:hypothetical protein
LLDEARLHFWASGGGSNSLATDRPWTLLAGHPYWPALEASDSQGMAEGGAWERLAVEEFAALPPPGLYPAEVAALQRARAAEISGPWIMVLRHLLGGSLPELRELLRALAG